MAIRILLVLITFAFASPALAQEPAMEIVVYDKGRGTKGNGNGRLEANEQVWMMFYITNRSDKPLKGLSLQIAAKNARFEKNALPLGEIAPGKRIRAATRLVAPAEPGKIRILSEIKGAQAWPPYIYSVNDKGVPFQLDPNTGKDMHVADLPSGVDSLAQKVIETLPAGKVRVAVAPFATLGQTATDRRIGQITAELIATRLSSRPGVTVIGSSQVEQTLDEAKLSLLGLSQSKNAAAIGKRIEADFIVGGSVSETQGHFAVAARQVKVSDGSVVFSKEVLVPQESAIALASQFVVHRSTRDSLFRSMLFPGWGQYYNDDNLKGYAFTGLSAAIAGAAVYTHMQYQAVHQDYKDAPTQDDAYEFVDERESLFKSRNTLIAVGAGVWALNVLDAVISGDSGAQVNVMQGHATRQPVRVEPQVSPVVSVGSDGSSVARLDVRF